MIHRYAHVVPNFHMFLDAIASREPALWVGWLVGWLVSWLVGGHFLETPSLTCKPSKRSTFSFSRTIVGQE